MSAFVDNPYRPSATVAQKAGWALPYVVTLIVAVFVSLVAGYTSCYVIEDAWFRRELDKQKEAYSRLLEESKR